MTQKYNLETIRVQNTNSLNNSLNQETNRWQNMQNKNYNWYLSNRCL